MAKFNKAMIDVHTDVTIYLFPKWDWEKEDYEDMFLFIKRGYLIQDDYSNLFMINPEWLRHPYDDHLLGPCPWKPLKRTLQLKCRKCDCYGYYEDITDEDCDFKYGMCSDCEKPKTKKLKKKYKKECEDCGEKHLEENICDDCGLCANPSKPHRCCECSDSSDGEEQYCVGGAGRLCPYEAYIFEGWGGEYPIKDWRCDKCSEFESVVDAITLAVHKGN